jgi:hypothetical protein
VAETEGYWRHVTKGRADNYANFMIKETLTYLAECPLELRVGGKEVLATQKSVLNYILNITSYVLYLIFKKNNYFYCSWMSSWVKKEN